jgi:predicted RecA/RadA family phage recombinase
MAQVYQGRRVSVGRNIDHTPAAAVSAGDVVVQDNLVGIANLDIAADALGALSVDGVFDLVKAEEAFATVGAEVFWDADGDPYNGTAGTGCLTATAAGNTLAGLVLVAAASTAEKARILLRSTVAVAVESLALANLSDVGATAYAAGSLLVADGDSYEEQAVSGPLALGATGILRLASATVAATGSIQGDAALVAEGFTLVTAADATKAALLPAAAAGAVCIIKNEDSANAVLPIFPAVGDAINALSANASLDIAAKTAVILVAYDATTWYSIPLLAS